MRVVYAIRSNEDPTDAWRRVKGQSREIRRLYRLQYGPRGLKTWFCVGHRIALGVMLLMLNGAVWG
jgi:hypothetical protein